MKKYADFAHFYPAYLAEHRNVNCRRLHFLGSFLVLLLVASALTLRMWWLLLLAPVVGYGFAWLGHFAFEHNRPATFSQPFYSFLGDWVMFKDILIGKVRI